MKKTLAFALITTVAIAIFILIVRQENSKNKKTFRIGISQIISHVGIDDVKNGIVAGFEAKGYKNGENIFFDFQNAQGETSINQSIAEKFANSNYDIFIPIGTQASQALINLVKNKPIIFASVTDPVSAGLLKSKENPGGNVTGTSDMTLFKEQLGLLKKLQPTAKKIGLVYNPGESNSQFSMQETQRFGGELGYEFVTVPANNTGEVMNAARSIVNKIDAFYILADNTVIAGQEAIIKVALDAKKPVIAVEQSGVEKGALATIGINYVKLGERTAEMALRVLNGEKPRDIPVLGVSDGDIFINSKTAKFLGISIPEDLIKQAEHVYE